jgi:hypothetical protein
VDPETIRIYSHIADKQSRAAIERLFPVTGGTSDPDSRSDSRFTTCTKRAQKGRMVGGVWPVSRSTESQRVLESSEICDWLPKHTIKSGRDRTRNDVDFSEIAAEDEKRAAQALHLAADLELERLIHAWPNLPAEWRRCILSIAEQAVFPGGPAEQKNSRG